MRAVVLAAGLGTRLRPLTFFLPKPLVSVAGKPIIDYVIQWLRRNRVSEIAVVGYYMQDVLERYITQFYPDVAFFKSRRLLGTAGQLYYVKEWARGDVAVVNADVLTDLDLSFPLRLHQSGDFLLTVVGQKLSHQLRFGILEDDGGVLKTWREKPRFDYVTSAGVYIVREEVFTKLKEEYLDMDVLARSLMPKVGLYVAKEAVFYDVGTLEDLEKTRDVELGDLKP